MITVAENTFFNIRGSFRLFGLIDIGTHASLVRLEPSSSASSNASAEPNWILIDSINFSPEQIETIRRTTNDSIKAIVNVHPFHTVYTPNAAQAFPTAKLYGTARHHEKHPSMQWEPTTVESDQFQTEFTSLFGEELDFSVPKGVDFVPSNENIHFSSVLVYHKPSKTVHSDDTFGVMRLPSFISWFGYEPTKIALHPTLGSALEKRVGAAGDFRSWLQDLLGRWDIQNLVAAHNSNYLANDVATDGKNMTIKDHLLQSLESWEPTLVQHEQKAQEKARQRAERDNSQNE